MTCSRSALLVIVVSILLVVSGCSDDPDDQPAAQPNFGEETTAVVIVNPVINENSTTDATPGDEREGIRVAASSADEDGPVTETDSTGLAVLREIPTGTVDLEVGDDVLELEVHEVGELYDVVVTYRDGTADYVIDPVRYRLGDIVELEDGDSLEEAVDDDTAVFLSEGSYRSDFELRADNVLIFGQWDPEEGPLAVLEDDFEVRGHPNRVRSVDLRGTITSRAGNFSMSFSKVDGAELTGQGVSLIRNEFLGDAETEVPSDDAVLVDNEGIP